MLKRTVWYQVACLLVPSFPQMKVRTTTMGPATLARRVKGRTAYAVMLAQCWCTVTGHTQQLRMRSMFQDPCIGAKGLTESSAWLGEIVAR